MFLESTAVRDFSRGAAASAAVPAAAPFFWRPDAEPLTPADVLAASAVQALKGALAHRFEPRLSNRTTLHTGRATHPSWRCVHVCALDVVPPALLGFLSPGKPAPALPELRAELQAAVAAGASLKRARVLHCAATAGVPAVRTETRSRTPCAAPAAASCITTALT